MALTARPNRSTQLTHCPAAVAARRTTAAMLAVLAVFAGMAAAMVAFSPPAQAQDGYKFWGYYHLGNGEWQPSKKGPQGFTATDGAVEGFRFASTTAANPERPPRAKPTFDDVCSGTQAAGSQKRIAFVLDYGTVPDAVDGDTPPPAEGVCAVVPKTANTQQALESVKPLRIEGGLVCAIDGYPSSGCAEEVTGVSVPASEKPVDLELPREQQTASAQNGGTPWPLVGVGAVVLVLGGGALVLARRRA